MTPTGTILPTVEAVDAIPAAALPGFIAQAAALQARAAARLATASEADSSAGLISLRELCRRIPYAEQTIRNLMSAGKLKLGVHYFRVERKLAFDWTALRQWIREKSETTAGEPFVPPFIKVARGRSR